MSLPSVACAHCTFFEPPLERCHRYPRAVQVAAAYWCGEFQPLRQPPTPVATIDHDVDDLELTVRTARVLKEQGISTIRQLVAFSDRDLMRMPGVGRKAVNELHELLQNIGLRLRDDRGVER